MKIEQLKTITAVDWNDVRALRVTLEKPWGRSGGLRFRCGTTEPKKNLTFDARTRGSQPYFPGTPIMWPREDFAVAGTPSATFIMPADITRMTTNRRGEPIPDARGHVGYIAFGFFMAPQGDTDGLRGFTIADERERVAAFWGGYKLSSKGDGTMNPPMTKVGAPNIPHVSLVPLDADLQPFRGTDGEEIVIRPREFFDFDNSGYYEADSTAPAGLADYSPEEIQAAIMALREVKRGKSSTR